MTAGSDRTPAGPNAHPAVQAAYAAYLDAWIDVANLPGVSECSASQAAAAQEAGYRLYEADNAHHEAWHAANREAHPELYRDGAGPDVMTAAAWQARYPLLNMDHRGVPTPYDLGQPVMEGDGGRPVYDCQPETADGCLIPVRHTYVTEIAVTAEPRELQVLFAPMPEPEPDEPEA